MTDRIHSLTVVLSKDLREDDVEELVTAIGLLKGVAEVGKNVRTLESFVYETRARTEIREQITAILWPDA